MKHLLRSWGVWSLFLGIASAVQADYDFTTLDVPGALRTQAFGVNNLGQIVGSYIDAAQVGHGFLRTGGQYTTLDVPGGTGTVARGINNAGQIVGSYSIGGVNHGFLFSGGSYTLLDVPQSVSTTPTGINNAGQIVGNYQLLGFGGLGFLLSGGNYGRLDSPGGIISINGINDRGQIVGTNTQGGFLLSEGNSTSFTAPNALGTSTSADGINNASQIVGSYLRHVGRDEFVIEGFLLSGDRYTPLDIDGPNSVVGTMPNGINDAGMIIGGYGRFGFGAEHGFLATPTAAPVPELASVILLGISTLGVIGWTRRRHLRTDPSSPTPGATR